MARLDELSRVAGGELKGPPDLEITGVGSLERAGPGMIAPLDSGPYLKLAKQSKAEALLAAHGLAAGLDRPAILAEFPLVALNKVIEHLELLPPPPQPGVHPSAVIDPTAELGAELHIGPHVFIGPGARVGARTVLMAGVFLEGDVVLGEECHLDPHVVIHNGARIGNRVRIGAHAVISRPGFGFAPGPKGPVRLHHIGTVVIEDGADIGAAVMVDRARYDETRIGAGSGLDNLVHIAHNCSVGKRTFIAAQTGLAGRGRIGDDCEVGGQVGVSNDCGTGDRCRVGAKSGLARLHGDDQVLWGVPAQDRRDCLREIATVRKLARSQRHSRE